jgi:hypothetical protein
MSRAERIDGDRFDDSENTYDKRRPSSLCSGRLDHSN